MAAAQVKKKNIVDLSQQVIVQPAPQRNLYPVAILNAQAHGIRFPVQNNSSYMSVDDR